MGNYVRPGIAVLFIAAICSTGLIVGQATITANGNSNASTTTSTSVIEVSGRVLDSRTRQPVSRALVRMGGRAVLSDHDGVFTFTQVSAASGVLEGSKPGYYASSEGEVNAPRSFRFSATAPIELLLYPESILSGSAISNTGEGIGRLSVSARRSVYDEKGHRWVQAGQTQTHGDGSFRMTVPAGVYSVMLSQRGRPQPGTELLLPLSVPPVSSSVTEALHLGVGQEIRLNLRPESRKAHQITLQIEPELKGFPVLTAVAASGISMPLTPMPDRGLDRDELRVALPSGTFTLHASMQNQDGVATAETQVTVTDHDLTGIPLRFTPAPVLPVVIEADLTTSDNGTILPNPAQLGLSLQPVSDRADSNGQVYRVTSRRNLSPAFSVQDGIYQLRAQSGGQWSITSATCGGLDLLTESIPISSAMNGTEIRLRVSNQSANLTGAVTLNGVPGAAWVYLFATTPSASPVIIVRSNSDGSFSRPYLPVGTYRAVAVESKISVDFRAATLDQFLDRLQSFSVSAGEQRKLNLVAVPQQDLPQ